MRRRASLCMTAFSTLLCAFVGCDSENAMPQDLSPGVVIKLEGMDALHQELAAHVKSCPTKMMSRPGLVGALGGAKVKLLKAGTHDVLLPLPQLADGQVPVCYHIHSLPQEAAIEYRLQERERTNHIVRVPLRSARNQEIQIEWSAVILVAGTTASPAKTKPDAYRMASACVQADADEIKRLADKLWPNSGHVSDYAGNIQRAIREMKPAKQPRSLDALGILDSGANGICTANANLALALLRARGIAARAVAVIPPISQRLEMHRIVEYFYEDQWLAFDPSSLQAELPMKPWQSVIMARTTIADENLAMKPRMGAMRGCPFGQELELASTGVTLTGQDFFWTIAKPLAEFELDEEAIALATDVWTQFLREGTQSPAQVKAGLAASFEEFRDVLQAK